MLRLLRNCNFYLKLIVSLPLELLFLNTLEHYYLNRQRATGKESSLSEVNNTFSLNSNICLCQYV